jgi:hypothetical protein
MKQMCKQGHHLMRRSWLRCTKRVHFRTIDMHCLSCKESGLPLLCPSESMSRRNCCVQMSTPRAKHAS